MEQISFDEFDTWAEGQSGVVREQSAFMESEHFEDEGVRFHRGDLIADELMVAPVTVIEGNLTAASIAQEFEVGLLVVTGDLRVECIEPLNMSIIIGGNLNARFVVADSSNDCELFVGGNIVCNYFVEAGCYVEVSGKIICPVVWNNSNIVIADGGIEGELIDGRPDDKKRRLLVDDVLDEDGYLNRTKLLECLRAGKSPYRF